MSDAARHDARSAFSEGLDANRTGKFAEAMRHFERAELQYRTAPGAESANERVKCLILAGNMAIKLGDIAAARERYQEAATSMESLSSELQVCRTRELRAGMRSLDQLETPPMQTSAPAEATADSMAARQDVQVAEVPLHAPAACNPPAS